MITFSYTRLLATLCVVFCFSMLTSCDKDDDVKTSKIELISFGPTGAKHGDTIRFFGNNLNKVTAVQFTGGTGATIEQKDFKEQNYESIKVIVPPAAERGLVTLKTPEGDVVSKTQFNLNVTTAVVSMTLQARPGANITINGSYLNWVERITFNRDKIVQAFVTKTQTQIVVKVPDDAQTGPLILHYGGTVPADVQTADTLKVTLPVATSFAPSPVKPGTNVTITGTDLDLVKKVIFSGVAAITTFVSQTATQLVVAVPAAAKTAKLTLEAASGVQTISAPDLNVVLPVITSMSPASINLGATLTITGTDLDLAKKVIFSGVAQPVTTFASQSATQITLAIPAGARDGQVKLEAASAVQTTSVSSIDVILPFAATISPNPVFPASDITITGTQLDMVKSIAFQNAPAVTAFVSQSPTQIVVTVPNGVLSGKLTLGLLSPTDTVQSSTSLQILGGVPPPVVALTIFNDAVTASWNGWVGGGWGGTKDLNNASPVRDGTKSCRIDYTSGAYGVPFQLGGATIPLGSYTTLKVSIYGGTGSSGKTVNVGFNEADGKTISIVEGVWTDFSIPLSQISAVTTLTHLYLKNYSASGAFTIYVDVLGLN